MSISPPETHVFKSTDTYQLSLDIYRPLKSSAQNVTLLYFHAGGLVDYNRQFVQPHIVQATLKRGWTLVSADHRLLPQASGQDLLDDAYDAWKYIQGLGLDGKLIVSGSSAGAFMAFLAGHYFKPRPTAVLNYYGVPSFKHEFFQSGKIFGSEPMKRSTIQHYLEEGVTAGETPLEYRFDYKSLLDDCTPRSDYVKPKGVPLEGVERTFLYDWFVQEGSYPELVGDLDKGYSKEAWEGFPRLISIHGDADVDVPIELAQEATENAENAELIVAHGKAHNFDDGLYLGDPQLEAVEKAWAALEKAVVQAADGSC